MQTQAESDHMNRQLQEHFWAREFVCPCCKQEGIKEELVGYLQFARNELPKYSVINITEGYRCIDYTREKGRSETSSHLRGLAADIACDNSGYRYYLIEALKKVGFTRIGIGRDFVHCDLDKDKAQNVMWTYS